MPSVVMNVIYGFIALSLLILVHELGHYLVARLTNVKVLAFSLGFGKKLINFKKGETEYAISAIPLGGYVKMLGESPDDEVKEEEINRSYSNKPPYIRMLIVFTGPLFNILFAFVLFCFVFLSGYTVPSTKVSDVEKGYPAYTQGIQKGDVIINIDGKDMKKWEDIAQSISKAGNESVEITLMREGALKHIWITPLIKEEKNIFGETIRRKVIGIAPEFVEQKGTLTSAVSMGFYQTYNLTKLTVLGIIKLIEGTISPKNIGGPILIFKEASKRAQEGKSTFVSFVALISINLGVINLLPIPILDGGHIIFNLIEVITRRKVSHRAIDIAQKVGMVLLVLLMVFAFYNDLDRLFQFDRLIGGK